MHHLTLQTILILTLSFLNSCSAPSKQFYVLTPQAHTTTKKSTLNLGIGPVSLASYLDRPNLVFQQNNNQLIIAESHRWAGNLEDNITRVLATNLSRQLGTNHVRTYPWQGDDSLTHQITIDINNLHANSEGDAIINATWRIYTLPSRQLITQSSWTGTQPLRADGYSQMIATQSQLLSSLTTQIITTLPK